MFKTQNKFIGFTSGVKDAYISGDFLSGIFDRDVKFKLSVVSDNLLNLVEIDTNFSTADIRANIVDDIDRIRTTIIYDQMDILEGMVFIDDNGSTCYLIKEVKSPYEFLKSLNNNDELSNEINILDSDTIDILNTLIKYEVTESEDSQNVQDESIDIIDDDLGRISVESYNSAVLNEAICNKVSELKERAANTLIEVERSRLEYINYKSLYESKLSELELLNSRIESMVPNREYNNILYNIETSSDNIEIDKSKLSIISKIAKKLSIDNEALVSIIKSNTYDIEFKLNEASDKSSIKEVIDWLKSDVESYLYTKGNKIRYSGKYEWHDINNKLSKLGFKRNIEK